MALIHVGFFSEVMGMCMSCDVILPQYSQSLIGMKTAEATGPRKVLYLLHGASDDHTIWQRRTSIERYAAPLGLAVVMPAAHLSSYADMAHGQKSAMVDRQNNYTSEVLHRLGFYWSTTSQDYIERMLTAIAGFGFFE